MQGCLTKKTLGVEKIAMDEFYAGRLLKQGRT